MTSPQRNRSTNRKASLVVLPLPFRQYDPSLATQLVTYILHPVPIKRQANFRMDPELMEAMDKIREKTGAPVSWQVRQGIRLWLKAQGVKLKSDRKREPTRKRS